MEISENGGYHAVIEDCRTLRMPDGKSVFKVYFVSITGRDKPEKYEWSLCGMSKESFLERLVAKGPEGIGVVTAFPHVSKIFRYAPKSEVMMHVTEFNTQTGEPIGLDRGEGYMEFACLAESVIAGGEYIMWSSAGSVEAYLGMKVQLGEVSVAVKDKLKTYWEKQ